MRFSWRRLAGAGAFAGVGTLLAFALSARPLDAAVLPWVFVVLLVIGYLTVPGLATAWAVRAPLDPTPRRVLSTLALATISTVILAALTWLATGQPARPVAVIAAFLFFTAMNYLGMGQPQTPFRVLREAVRGVRN